MTTTPDTTTADRNLDAACTTVTAEIARSDSKASLLLAFTGAVLVGLASAADKDLPPFTKAVGGFAVLVLGSAAVLLLLVVRPRSRPTPHGERRIPPLGLPDRGRPVYRDEH